MAIQNTVLSAQAKYGYIPGLDGLRAFAVLIVILAHIGLYNIIPGGFGVTIFFFISGFLITRLLIAETDKSGKIGLKNFYIRRFLRLLPALYVMLIGTIIVKVLMNDLPGFWETIASFTYTMNYRYASWVLNGVDTVGPWNHLWSLAVEEHFYLLFPLLLVFFRKNLDLALKACLAVCIAALTWRAVNYYGLNMPGKYNYLATETRIDSIVYGCVLSLMLHLRPASNILKSAIGWVPLIGAIAVLMLCFVVRDEGFRQTLRYSLQGMALFIGILNLYFFKPVSFSFKILEFAPLRWIGRVSYGLYLWHIPAMVFADKYMGYGMGTWQFVVISLVLTFGLTSLSFYYVEKPIIGLRRKFGSHVKVDSKGEKIKTSEDIKKQRISALTGRPVALKQ